MRKIFLTLFAAAVTATAATAINAAPTAMPASGGAEDVTAEAADDEDLPAAEQFYSTGINALENGDIDEAIHNLNMAYCFSVDDNKAFADKVLKQLQEIKKKHGKEFPVALPDLIKKFKKVELANFGSFQVTDRNDKIGVYSFGGKEIIPAVYDNLGMLYTNNGLCWILTKNGKSGLVDEDGTQLLPFDYDDIMDFNTAASGADEELSYYYVTENGKEGFVEQNSLRFFPFDGVVTTLTPAAAEQDPAKAVVVAVAPGQMPTTTDDDDAEVDTDPLVKYAVTLDGKEIIPPTLEATTITSGNGMFYLQREQDGMPYYAIAKGDGTLIQDFSRFCPRQLFDYIPIPDAKGKWTFFNTKTWEKRNIGPFDDVRHIAAMQTQEWYFAAKLNDKWALLSPDALTPLTPFSLQVTPYNSEIMNEMGIMETDPEEEMPQTDIDELAVNTVLVIDGKYAVLGNINGNDMAYAISRGEDGMRVGVADTKGNVIVQPNFVDITPFHNGKALAKPSKDENYIVIDRRGTKIDDTNWDAAMPINEMIIVRAGDEDKVGAIDLDLNIIYPCVHTPSELFEKIFGTVENEEPAEK